MGKYNTYIVAQTLGTESITVCSIKQDSTMGRKQLEFEYAEMTT